MVLKTNNYFSSVPSFIQKLEVAPHHFDLQRCDEKTLYIKVVLKYRAHQVLCDFIYIMDQQEVYGAISINEHYANAKKFIKQHFGHTLIYSDELLLAKNFMGTTFFFKSVRQFAKQYPKFISKP
ncbi:hypothetical protein ACQKII_08975 [Lysinibacillus sp. NPDC048646]|uniref:hypothetical protein n=1 Tax=Lysinibacillus sp. NPDC048646 TaxID=3390574 RepID=UPI003D062A4B